MILRPGTFLQDRYEILDQIGSGGMSDVYKALCHKLKRPVAIKVLKEEFSTDSGFVSKFKMEAQAAARLSHPNIVNVYDVVDEGNIHYIVMELIEGITLKNYISKKGHLEINEAIGITIQVAQGIAAAHEQGIIHRDIKPQNIIIARDGKVKVADFGIARAASSQTLSATAMGSVHYISPEQARGGYSDARSDIYSLGITMYEMVTGRVPFEGDNTVTVALAHLEDPITPPSYFNQDIPVSLENIILKCTEKKQEYRYDNAQEVIADLRRALITPNEDFVEQTPSFDDDNSETVIISPPELDQIRSGRRSQPQSSSENNRSYQNQRNNQNELRRTSKGRGGSSQSNDYNDINPKLEKLLTAAGVAVAILIIAVLLFVFSKLSGLFHTGTPKETVTTEATATMEETLSAKQTKTPDVIGLAEDIARQKLKENGGLDMKIGGMEFSDTIVKGDVVSQKPEAEAVVDKYTAVTVILSKGPEEKEIDLTDLELENLTADAAKMLLEDSNLVVKVEQQYSDTIEAGKLISYSPKKAVENSTITLVFSIGPAIKNPSIVPDLANQQEDVGIEMLADAGLVAGEVTQEISETVPAGSIIRQSIEANKKVETGTTVDYVVSKGTAEQAKYRYLASIDTSYSLENLIGPGSGSTQLTLKICLRQNVNGKDEVRDLLGPVTLKGNQLLPVSFKNIEGAYGVTNGEIQIVNVDSGEVVNSYPLTFIPVPQS